MLNHIYLVSERKAKSVTKFLPFQLHGHINNALKNVLPAVPNAVNSWVEDLKKLKNDFIEESSGLEDGATKLLKKKTLQFMQQASDADDDTLISYASTLNDVVIYNKRWCDSKLAETMFISLFFSSIVNNTFGMLSSDLFKFDMQDKSMSNSSMKPDYLVSVLSGYDEQLDVYSMEAKTPEASKGDRDFIKLGNTMKIMVDELVSRGCPLSSAVSFGTLLHDQLRDETCIWRSLYDEGDNHIAHADLF